MSLDYGSRYDEFDSRRATLDPLRDAKVEAALAPLETFISDLAERADDLNRGTLREKRLAAACLLDSLSAWAREDALSDLRTETVRLTIGARLAAFALITWQAASYAPDHPGRADILAWLSRRVEAQTRFWVDAPPGAQQGNLRAWAALAAAALAIQTDRPDLAEWSRAALEDVLCTAEADGSLPQEMSRGRYALHYQLHATGPLVLAAVLLEQQDIAAAELCDRALHRVVAFTAADLRDGTRTEARTGVVQTYFDGSDRIEPFQLAWLEPYRALVESEALGAALVPLRPLHFSKFGGNQTALWAR